MPEPEVTTIAPEATETKTPVNNDAPKIDPTRPLSQQVSTLSKLMGDTAEPSVETPKEEEKPAEPVVDDNPKKEDEPAPIPNDPDDEDEIDIPAPITLDPAEKFLIDRLPTISARLKEGDGVKIYNVKSYTQIPGWPNVEFATKGDELEFQTAITAQELRADKIIAEYNNLKQQEAIKAFKAQEDLDVASDVARLQRQGILGKFDDNTPKSDPAVKEADEIYDLYQKTNQEYATKYLGTSRTFRISYADAADKYFAQKNREKARTPSEKPEDKAKTTPSPSQKEREEVAKKIGAPSSSSPESTKQRAKPGMSMNDINRLFTQGRI